MIERYTRKEMAAVWSERRKYQIWLEVELAVCRELAAEGVIPRKEWRELSQGGRVLLEKGGVDPRRVAELEATLRHDVIAFTTAVAEKVGPSSRFVHFGLTSSDVIDTSFALATVQAGKLLLEGVDAVVTELAKKAKAHQKLPTLGRSHGIAAEPTAFGLKFLGWACEFQRARARLERAVAGMKFGKLSGAVGVNAHWSPDFEERVLSKLGLSREPVSTQVIPRDRYAEFMWAVSSCGNSVERVAVELRHLQRTEVAEVMEGFSKGQKGSSAMPHKRNPISAENLTGCARLLRGYASACAENVALWHERDISHSSVERVAFPDATILLDYALHRLANLIQGLVVRRENVERNLRAPGDTLYSGHFLLELVKEGASREEAYYWVQECAIAAVEGKGRFLDLLKAHEGVGRYLGAAAIDRLGSLKHQLRHVDRIFQKATSESRGRARR
ncbi:MAG: adenylosuccinate lyase [Bdellovibrionales bacterium]|nr:adenylosuccinate lyase [Bdellovibrionales bacterium]